MLLTIKNLTICLRETEHPIVQNLSLTFGGGESLILLGQSGSGKTLTCKAITGLLNPRLFAIGGAICFNGEDMLSIPPKQGREIYGAQIALIPQNPMTALDPSMRVGKQMEETLRLHTGLKGVQAQAKIQAALHEAGLEQDVTKSYPHMLSGGMLQRVLVAMALMADAKLIVADEPTTALDAEHRNAAVDALLRLREKGTAVLLVTHDFAVASRIGGVVLVMKEGQIIEQGNASSLFTAPKNPYTRALLEASRLSGSAFEGGELAC